MTLAIIRSPAASPGTKALTYEQRWMKVLPIVTMVMSEVDVLMSLATHVQIRHTFVGNMSAVQIPSLPP